MKRKLLSLLVLLMAAATGAPAADFTGEGTEVSPYLIASADDWNTFATRVSEGNTNINGKTGYISANLLLWDSIRL